MRPPDDVLVRAEHLVVEYPTGRRGQRVHAVSDVSIDLLEGETVGLVGESGCGKSTIGRAILQLPKPTAGTVWFEGRELTSLAESELRAVRRQLQIILQDPISSINPRRRITEIVAEPLAIWNTPRTTREAKVVDVLESVGIDPDLASGRRRHQFSGGQCQRICIARALINEPKVIICDEPVSSLDVSVQAQILNLLEEMKARFGLTLLFISHDLAVVRHISDRIVVMYLGKVCEVGTPDALYQAPQHPYTAALVASIPTPRPGAGQLAGRAPEGELPSPINPPTGCRFRTRCPRADARCAAEEPSITAVAPGHFVACHHPLAPPPGSDNGATAPC